MIKQTTSQKRLDPDSKLAGDDPQKILTQNKLIFSDQSTWYRVCSSQSVTAEDTVYMTSSSSVGGPSVCKVVSKGILAEARRIHGELRSVE
jgi:hypothetical protein